MIKHGQPNNKHISKMQDLVSDFLINVSQFSF